MTMQELVQELLKHADEYAVESEEEVFVGLEPVRKHKRWRTQKKWITRWGMKPVYETKKCKKLDVTYDLIIQFCIDQKIPLPIELLTQGNFNDG